MSAPFSCRRQACALALARDRVVPLYYPTTGVVHSAKPSGARLGALSEVDLSSTSVRG